MPIAYQGNDPGNQMALQQYQFGQNQNQNALQQIAAQNQGGISQAKIAADAQKYGYNTSTTNAKIAANSQNYGYGTQLAGQKYQANSALQSALGTAAANLQGTQYSSDASKAASEYGSQQAANASMFGAQAGLQGQEYSSDAAKAASEFGASTAADASKYGADQSLAGVRYGTDATNQRFQQSLGWAQDRFGQIFNYIKDRTAGLGGTTAAAGIDTSGAPQITAAPVFTPGQIQANVNNAVGLVDQRTQGQGAALARQMGARGIGSRSSPLLQSLLSNNAAIGAGQAADSELNYRTNAAQANSQQLLAGQQAQQQQWGQEQGLGLQQQKNVLDYNSALLNALSGLGSIGNIGG